MAVVASQMPALLGRSAFDLFAENGFGNVNLDQVAARAGVTKGSLYWHYKNKQALVLAACNHYYTRWFRAVNADLASVVDPEARLRKTLEFSVHSCVIDRKNRIFTTGIFMLMQEDAAVKASWQQFYSSVREFYVGLVMAGVANGKLATRDAHQAVDLMLEAIEGIKLRASFEPHIAEPSEQAALVDGLWRILND